METYNEKRVYANFNYHFANFTDYRQEHKVKHLLVEILYISAIRKHWHIENKLHWILDVIFREDYCRLRGGNGAENMNIIRKIALNKMKSDKYDKDSIKGKKKKCGWDDNYAAKILWQMMA